MATARLMRRVALLALILVAAAAFLMLVPLVPQEGTGTRVPLDTWLAGRLPFVRDLYRAYFARVFEPWRLPVLAVALWAALVTLFSWRSLAARIAGLVPPLSPAALGAFRVVFGVALALALARVQPPASVPLGAQRTASWLARTWPMPQLAAHPDAASWLHAVVVAALVCFALGLAARVALLAAVVGLAGFVGILLTVQGAHDWGVPLLTLALMLFVPWETSTGLTSWRRTADDGLDARRGFAIWVPGLTIGLAFAAAAFAKLDTSGLTWITGGAVRYHFIEDAGQAPTTWGLWLTGSDGRAALLSFGAVAVEALFWLVLIVQGWPWRLLFGLTAVGLLSGFYLFQGVFWPAWWSLLLAFLPWPLVDVALRRRTGATAPRDDLAAAAAPLAALPMPAGAVVALLLLTQIGASLMRVENEPFFSDFAMYAYTWPSRADFDAHLASKSRRLSLAHPGGEPGDLDGRLRELPRAFEVTTAAADAALRGQPWPDDLRTALHDVREAYRTRYQEPLDVLDVVAVERRFDWTRQAFDDAHVVAREQLDLERGTLRSPR